MFTPRLTQFTSMGAGRGGQRIQECAATLFALATPRRGFLCHFRAFLFVIAREQRDRGDPVDNKVARIRVRTLLTGLLRCARNDKYDVIHITWAPWSKCTPQKHSFLRGPRAPG